MSRSAPAAAGAEPTAEPTPQPTPTPTETEGAAQAVDGAESVTPEPRPTPTTAVVPESSGEQATDGVEAITDAPPAQEATANGPAGAEPAPVDTGPDRTLVRSGIPEPIPLSADTDGVLPLTDEDRAHIAATPPVDLDDPASIAGSRNYWFNDGGLDVPAQFVRDESGRVFEITDREISGAFRLQGEWLDEQGQPVDGPVEDGTITREVRDYEGEGGAYTVTVETITYADGTVVEARSTSTSGIPGRDGQMVVDTVSGTDEQGRPYTTVDQTGTDGDGRVVTRETATTTVLASDTSGSPTLLEVETSGFEVLPGHGMHEYGGTVHVGDGNAPIGDGSPASIIDWGERFVGEDGSIVEHYPVVDEAGRVVGGVTREVPPGSALTQRPPIVGRVEVSDGMSTLVAPDGSTIDGYHGANAYTIPDDPGAWSTARGWLGIASSLFSVGIALYTRGAAAGGAASSASTLLALVPFLTTSVDPDELTVNLAGVAAPAGSVTAAALGIATLLDGGGDDDPRPDWVQVHEAVESRPDSDEDELVQA